MRTLLSIALLVALAGCGERATEDSTPTAPADAASVAESAEVPAAETPAADDSDSSGSLRVDAPAEGAITFQGFGPAKFGAPTKKCAWPGAVTSAMKSHRNRVAAITLRRCHWARAAIASAS